MLGEVGVLEAPHTGGDPGSGPPMAGKASVRNDIVSLRNDELVLVAKRVGERSDEVEQPVATRRNVSAVLNVAVGPEPFRGRIVALVEERIERLQDERLVLLGRSLSHVSLR